MKNTTCIVAVLCVAFSVQNAETQTTQTAPPEKTLPLQGEVFRVEGRTAFLISPDKNTSTDATPWVWYAPTLPGLPGTEERWMFERFTKAGIAIAGIDVGESYGSPDGRKLFSAFHREMTEKRGFAQKPVLPSRGFSQSGIEQLIFFFFFRRLSSVNSIAFSNSTLVNCSRNHASRTIPPIPKSTLAI